MKKQFHLIILSFCLSLFIISCSSDEAPDTGVDTNVTVWDGPMISFAKDGTSDPTLMENQDRITDNVWITRGTDGGQIYNAKTEDVANKNNSPAGTLWAKGDISNIENLTFNTFRETLDKPKDAIGESLVMLLEEDNIAISVEITAWGQNREGSFSYMRSTQQ